MHFDRIFSTRERAIIQAFLQVDPNQRLGSLFGGTDLIKSQPYYETIPWESLATQVRFHSQRINLSTYAVFA
jgi:hypothetical protein